MPTDDGLQKARKFKGMLIAGAREVSLSFDAHISDAGEIVLELEQISLTRETTFIVETWHSPDDLIVYFSLRGASVDDVTFETERLHFSSIGPHSDAERGSYFVFAARCSDGTFRRQASDALNTPILHISTRGFQSFPELRSSCELGDLVMGGDIKNEVPDKISGFIHLRATVRPTNVIEWRAHGERLLDHLRRVMSFAAGTNITDPVLTYRFDTDIEVNIKARGSQYLGHIPTFHPLDRQKIFDAAVRSFRNPPYPTENLWMALEWFSMNASYNEVRLINTMTALENLVSSNTRDVAQLMNDETFARFKTALSARIEQFIREEGLNGAFPKRPNELEQKLVELQRRSLRRKLDVLLARWSVPMDGITKSMIRGAFNARNDIVHEGRYYTEGKQLPDLWQHVCVAREIVARLVFRALGFEGRYLSQLGGYHDATFPPQRSPPDSG